MTAPPDLLDIDEQSHNKVKNYLHLSSVFPTGQSSG